MWIARIAYSAVVVTAGMLAVLCDAAFVHGQVYDRGQNGFWAFYWENDTFYDTDQSYTNGVRIAQVRGLDQTGNVWWLPDNLLRRAFGPSCTDDERRCWEWSGGWTVGQQMYTPQDIRSSEAITDDRPYGGWLYIGKVVHVSRPDIGVGELRAVQHTFEVDVGVTGEPSFAAETQTFVHEHVAKSAPAPKGWSNQIGTGPGIALQYIGRTRSFEKLGWDRRVFDVISDWTAVAGNIYTLAGGGVTARFGYNLGTDFGPTIITPTAPMMGRDHDFEAYGVAGAQARAVAYNVFLDGRWFTDDAQTVTRKPVVADVFGGVFVRYRWVGLNFRWVRRTPEFRERRVWQEYGSLNLIFLF